ncbi:hypothetical protein V2J09_021992 [Rumex salicifolius]
MTPRWWIWYWATIRLLPKTFPALAVQNAMEAAVLPRFSTAEANSQGGESLAYQDHKVENVNLFLALGAFDW